MQLRIDKPEDNKVVDLAPRVQAISGEREFEWGWALCLTSGGHSGQVSVLWDEDGIIEDVDAGAILFRSF